jgi:diguanylate cyclase (GGDEF)-like protein
VYVETLADRLVDESSLGELLLTSRDVSERKEFESRLTHQALHDPLTGLGNRTLFASVLDEALNRADEIAVMFIDMDDFKSVNDTLGHDAGDKFLAEASQRLASCLRPTDTAARVGGDEFAVMLEGCNERAAKSIAKRMLGVLEPPFAISGKTLQASASIGIAMGSGGVDTSQDLMGRADAAMYAAKSQGKGRTSIFGPDELLTVV